MQPITPPNQRQSASLEEPSPKAADEFIRLYFEAGERTWLTTTWFGVPCAKLPLDLWSIQEIVLDTRPDLIVETGVLKGGSTLFFATLFDLIGAGKVIGIDNDLSQVEERVRRHPRIELIEADSADPGLHARVDAKAEGHRVMVDLDADHSFEHVLAELRGLAPLVTPGCYLVVEDTVVNGNPVMPQFGPGPSEALSRWFEESPPFEVDTWRERLLGTFNRGGFLRRLGEDGAVSDPIPLAPMGTSADDRAQSLEDEVASLRRSLVTSSQKTRQLRESLAEARQEVRLRERLEQRVADLEAREQGLHAQLGEANSRLAARDDYVLRLETRLRRIHGSLPFRLLNRLRGVPPLRWIARRRAQGFQQELQRARRSP